MPPEWNIYYWRWIIEDGQPDLRVGEQFDWFALDFWTTRGLAKIDDRSGVAIAVNDYKYKVVAELVYLSEKSCVIDFGLRAVGPAGDIPPGCKQGDFVAGEISIGIPLCTDVLPEEVSKTLAHKWEVNRISADLTPYITQPISPRFFFRDESQIRYDGIASTDAVRAKGYVLHCTKIA
jgi:hypothetical protein